MQVTVLLYDGVSTVEALGPIVVLRRLPDAHVRLVAAEPGPQLTHEPPLTVIANEPLGWAGETDVLVVPGGFGIERLLADTTVINWVRRIAPTARCVVGMSTGSLVLAAAGVLDGRDATAHWLTLERLPEWGARPVPGRPVVRAGRAVTSTGGRGAFEAALTAVEIVAGAGTAEDIRSELARNPAAFDLLTVEGVTVSPPGRGRSWWPRWRRRQRRKVVTLVPPKLT